MKTTNIRIIAAAAVITAVSALSSCGSAPASTPASTAAQTTVTAAATTPETTTAPETTTTATTTTTAATTTTTAETTMSEEQRLKYDSDRYTETYKGEKLTEVKAFMINKGVALESDIYMFTDDGDSLDHFYNAPSTYDITKIVFREDGTVSLYGVKNRLVPDAAKDAIKQNVIDRLADKLLDPVLGDD